MIALASRKQYISLNVCATDAAGYIAERYKLRLPKASIGKSCVRFKKLADVDLGVVQQMVEHAATLAGGA